MPRPGRVLPPPVDAPRPGVDAAHFGARSQRPARGEPGLRADTRLVSFGVDGPEDSNRNLALRWAAEYAGSFGGEVEAVAAPEIKMTAALTDSPTGGDNLRDASERLDKAIAEVLGAETNVPVKRTVTGACAARALVEASTSADVLVIGSSGQGEMPGMHIGSTTNYCHLAMHDAIADLCGAGRPVAGPRVAIGSWRPSPNASTESSRAHSHPCMRSTPPALRRGERARCASGATAGGP